jgi:hypothetical protein
MIQLLIIESAICRKKIDAYIVIGSTIDTFEAVLPDPFLLRLLQLCQ